MEILTTIHDIWRYAVLLTALVALALCVMAYAGSRAWDDVTDRSTLFFTIAIDIQVLIGVLVWIFGNWDRNNSWLLWIHPVLMIVGAGLAHMGRVMSERASGPRNKGIRAVVFFVASLIVILVAIPLNAWPLGR